MRPLHSRTGPILQPEAGFGAEGNGQVRLRRVLQVPLRRDVLSCFDRARLQGLPAGAGGSCASKSQVVWTEAQISLMKQHATRILAEHMNRKHKLTPEALQWATKWAK